MSIILDGLKYLAYILIFPGFLFCFLSGLLLCGIDRKLVARMQKRVGPPVLQPFYDFFKLLGKETIIPVTANRTVFLLAPLVGLAAQVVLQLFIPVFSFNAFQGVADVIVILYLLLIPALSVILGAASSGSPYSGVGLSREMVTILGAAAGAGAAVGRKGGRQRHGHRTLLQPHGYRELSADPWQPHHQAQHDPRGRGNASHYPR